MKIKMKLMVALGALLLSSLASASLIKVTVSGVFDGPQGDGGTLKGTFQVDPLLLPPSGLSSVSVTTTDGSRITGKQYDGGIFLLIDFGIPLGVTPTTFMFRGSDLGDSSLVGDQVLNMFFFDNGKGVMVERNCGSDCTKTTGDPRNGNFNYSVPAPAVPGLIAAGLLGVGLMRRRRTA